MIAYVVAIAMIPITLIVSAIVMTVIRKIFNLTPRPANLRLFGILFGVIFFILGLLAVNGALELLDETFEPFHSIIIGAASFIGGWFGARSALEKAGEETT